VVVLQHIDACECGYANAFFQRVYPFHN